MDALLRRIFRTDISPAERRFLRGLGITVAVLVILSNVVLAWLLRRMGDPRWIVKAWSPGSVQNVISASISGLAIVALWRFRSMGSWLLRAALVVGVLFAQLTTINRRLGGDPRLEVSLWAGLAGLALLGVVVSALESRERQEREGRERPALTRRFGRLFFGRVGPRFGLVGAGALLGILLVGRLAPWALTSGKLNTADHVVVALAAAGGGLAGAELGFRTTLALRRAQRWVRRWRRRAPRSVA